MDRLNSLRVHLLYRILRVLLILLSMLFIRVMHVIFASLYLKTPLLATLIRSV